MLWRDTANKTKSVFNLRGLLIATALSPAQPYLYLYSKSPIQSRRHVCRHGGRPRCRGRRGACYWAPRSPPLGDQATFNRKEANASAFGDIDSVFGVDPNTVGHGEYLLAPGGQRTPLPVENHDGRHSFLYLHNENHSLSKLFGCSLALVLKFEDVATDRQ